MVEKMNCVNWIKSKLLVLSTRPVCREDRNSWMWIASPKAYGAVVYFGTENRHENLTTCLVISKSRVVPAQEMTLLRLELLALYVAAKLVEYVIQSFTLMVDKVYAW